MIEYHKSLLGFALCWRQSHEEGKLKNDAGRSICVVDHVDHTFSLISTDALEENNLLKTELYQPSLSWHLLLMSASVGLEMERQEGGLKDEMISYSSQSHCPISSQAWGLLANPGELKWNKGVVATCAEVGSFAVRPSSNDALNLQGAQNLNEWSKSKVPKRLEA